MSSPTGTRIRDPVQNIMAGRKAVRCWSAGCFDGKRAICFRLDRRFIESNPLFYNGLAIRILDHISSLRMRLARVCAEIRNLCLQSRKLVSPRVGGRPASVDLSASMPERFGCVTKPEGEAATPSHSAMPKPQQFAEAQWQSRLSANSKSSEDGFTDRSDGAGSIHGKHPARKTEALPRRSIRTGKFKQTAMRSGPNRRAGQFRVRGRA